MVGWHHRLNGHEFEQAPRVGDGRGGLACWSPWGRKSRTRLSELLRDRGQIGPEVFKRAFSPEEGVCCS